jgi:thiol:disulfide interchange protein DsbA
MLRRDFALSLLATGAALPAWAQRIAPKEGTEYMKLAKPVPTQAPAGQIEVLEFFAYSCIHCARFEPLLENWESKRPANTVLRRVPVAFSTEFVPMQRLFYALEAMGKLGELHAKVFEAIHGQRLPLTTPGPITEWVVRQGVDRARFTELFNHPDTTEKAKRAAQLQDAYGVEGTPAMGVAGRFYIPGQGERTLSIANALIAQARQS